MTENEQKQQLSIAYVHAVAARAGFATEVTGVDDDSVDVTIAARGKVHDQAVLLSPRIEVQLKASSQDLLRDDHLSFRLPIKNYDDLRGETLVPRLLVLLLLPHEKESWLEHRDDELVLRRSAYWSSLRGRPPTGNTASMTIAVPCGQRFTFEGLREMMHKIAKKETL